jgi:hypothetical protein
MNGGLINFFYRLGYDYCAVVVNGDHQQEQPSCKDGDFPQQTKSHT